MLAWNLPRTQTVLCTFFDVYRIPRSARAPLSPLPLTPPYAYGGSMRKYARFGRKIAKVARASKNMHAARRRGDCENMQHEVRAIGRTAGFFLRQPFVRPADLSDCEFLVRALLISCGLLHGGFTLQGYCRGKLPCN